MSTPTLPPPTCLANDVGVEDWFDVIRSPEPTGDCSGDLYRIKKAKPPIHVCERHLLQYRLFGRWWWVEKVE